MTRIASIAALLCLVLAVAAGELRPLPWSTGLNDPARFRPNSSGKCVITRDTGENAVKIHAEFQPGTDLWCYPELTFQKPMENFEDVEELRFEIKFDLEPKGFRYVYLMLDGHPHYTLPTPDGNWQKIAVNFRDAKINPTNVMRIRIGSNPWGRELTFRIRNIEMLSGKPWPTEFDTAASVTADAPGTMFLEGEKTTFSLRNGVNRPAAYILRDWQGNQLQTGEWPENGKGKLHFDRLPQGYYTLNLTGKDGLAFTGQSSFAVVADPAKRKRNPNSYFALDSAQSWLARSNHANSRHPQDGFEIVSEIARRSGTAMVRERMSWGEIEQQPGKYQWKQYKTNANLLQKRGIPILGMYHNSPNWTRSATTMTPLPEDLLATYRYAKKLTQEFQGQMTVWEFWNEPDIYYTLEGAWDYASALKAAYLGYKAGNPELPVALGGIAKTILTPYNDTLMANAAGDYFDIYNIHTYHQLVDYPELSKDIFAFLKRHDLDTRPAWMTENGCRAEGPGRRSSYMPAFKVHNPEQELLVAEFLPKAMIQLQFDGFDRDFFFVLPPYSEEGGKKDWGLMRRDYTIKPGLAAFANLAANLENAKLEGEIDLGNPELRGFLYRQTDNRQTLVYWTKSELDTDPRIDDLKREGEKQQTFALSAADGTYSGRNLFGTPFETRAANGKLTLTATRMPAFLHGLAGLQPTHPALRPGTRKNADESAYNRSIVFQTSLSNDFALSIDKESADISRKTVALKLLVWNLSSQEQSGTVMVSGGKVIGLPVELAVPAFGKQEYQLKFTPEIDAERKGEFHVTGTFGDKAASPLVIPLTRYNNLDDATRTLELTDMLTASNWRKNASGSMEIVFDEKENAIRFTTQFIPETHDRWIYPEYLLHLPEESLAEAIGISFEVKAIPAYGLKQMLVMAVPDIKPEVGDAYYFKAASPATEWETRTISIDQHDFDPATIKQLRFGMNTTQPKVTFFLRNVKILYGK